MRFLAALAVVLLVLTGCTHEEKTVEDSPEEIARQQAIIDRLNASTTTSIDEDAGPAITVPPDYEGVDKLRVGDCVDQASDHVIDVSPITCDERHHAEVTLVVDLAKYGERFPSEQDFDQILQGDCTRAFDAYTGHGPNEEIGVGTYVPLPESWAFPSSRRVTCLVRSFKEGNVLTGSARKKQ